MESDDEVRERTGSIMQSLVTAEVFGSGGVWGRRGNASIGDEWGVNKEAMSSGKRRNLCLFFAEILSWTENPWASHSSPCRGGTAECLSTEWVKNFRVGHF